MFTEIKASEIEVGHRLCEGDGFMWEVTTLSRTACFVTLGLKPVWQTMLREQPTTKRFKLNATLRKAS